MSDPRYPSEFQRPGPGPQEGAPPAAPDLQASVPAPASQPQPATDVPRTPPPAPRQREGNRIVLLGGDADGAPASGTAARRNPAIGGLYVVSGTLMLLALLGGTWSQGLLRRIEFSGFGTMLNPDGLIEMTFRPEDEATVGLARLLVQLAPTTLALGVLALLAAIALPILTRRPR